MPPGYFGILILGKSQAKKEVTVLIVVINFDFDYQEKVLLSEYRKREDYAWFHWQVS